MRAWVLSKFRAGGRRNGSPVARHPSHAAPVAPEGARERRIAEDPPVPPDIQTGPDGCTERLLAVLRRAREEAEVRLVAAGEVLQVEALPPAAEYSLIGVSGHLIAVAGATARALRP